MPLPLKWILVAIFLVGSAAQFINGHVLLGSALAFLCAIYLVLAIRHKRRAPAARPSIEPSRGPD